MSRWDYDTVFYRVFCITLLAVAFTFTVVLTNVFVDIDGLLSKKDKSQTPKPDLQKMNDIAEIMNVNFIPEDKSEDVYDDKDYQDSNDLYRSKRSLESSDLLFHVKDPKLKKILTNRLTLLLDELDEDETTTDINNKHNDVHVNNEKHRLVHLQSENNRKPDHIVVKKKPKQLKEDKIKPIINTRHEKPQETPNDKETFNTSKKNESTNKTNKNNNVNKEMESELLHLAMHNIVLQGIVGNMNLDDVYKKVADLVKKFENDHTKINGEEFQKIFKEKNRLAKRKEEAEAEKFTDDPILFKDLHKENDLGVVIKRSEEISDSERKTTPKPRDHNLMIKTIIDITALNNDRNNKESDKSFKNINGVVKLIYNGNTMKFKKIDDDYTDQSKNNNASEIPNEDTVKMIWEKNHEANTDVTSNYFENIIHDYIKRFPRGFDSSEHLLTRKRLKRHIKIRYDSAKITTAKPSPKKKKDDELFVEIETHFDSKGAKGEQKKKMIKEIIQKIQRAIHSDLKENNKNKSKHWHVKKRLQNSLIDKRAAFINKFMLPFTALTHRRIDPISKAVPQHEDMPLVSDDSGHNIWHRKYEGPRFLNKAINSAEMSTVNVDYDKVMEHNGIPQRLQKPLNTDISDEILQNSSIYDLGNLRFLMKDLDGTGFTIGFNQYTDEAPDPETMKLFSGLQNIIRTYHQKYDQTPNAQREQADDNDDRIDIHKTADADEAYEYEKKVASSENHNIERRSIKDSRKSHYHSNEYTKLFKNNFFPLNDHQEIFNRNKNYKSKARQLDKLKSNSLLIVDENIFEKKLKPGEILSIADLIERRKRSMQVKKITNVKIKNNLNRYLNTHKMASKTFFLNKKRNKRQIGKIRIVARDSSHPHRNSQEDIFVVSDEKIFADRAVVREVEAHEIEANDKVHSLEHYDIITPQKEEEPFDVINPIKVSDDHYDIVSPYTYDVSHIFGTHTNEFSRRARHNNLMSKYPHVFMEEIIKDPNNPSDPYPYAYAQYPPINVQEESTTQAVESLANDLISPNAQELVQLLASPNDQNNNYRVTVKIRPKNTTGMSGFKEVHTSINKIFDKNGLKYTSLTNVSQLSKIEKIDKNNTRRQFDDTALENLKQQQDLIKSLISQHKNRIDEQLQQLYKEKEKLEQINAEKVESLQDTLFNLPATVDINRPQQTGDAVSKIFKVVEPPTKAIRKAITVTKATTTTTEGTTVTTTKATTTAIPTSKSVPSATSTVKYETNTEKIDGTKLLDTIERNENITKAILKKIDQNTNVLQEFLGKLLAKIDISHKVEETTSHKETIKKDALRNEEPITLQNQNQNHLQQNKTIYDIPFNFDEYSQNIHKALFKNLPNQITNYSGIPFLYAYQQPLSMASNKAEPLASIVYHGHLHTNTINNINKPFNTPEKKQIDYNKHETNKNPYYKAENLPTEYYNQDQNKETNKAEKPPTAYYKLIQNKESYYKGEKTPHEYYKPDKSKETYYKGEIPPTEYYKQDKNKETYYKAEKTPPEYYKQDKNKETYYKAEKTPPEYHKQDENKETYYKAEKTPPEYYKQDENKETYYKVEKTPPEYYKHDSIVNVNLINPKPENNEVLKDIPIPSTEVNKLSMEKEFWQAKPGEKVLHNFVVKNNSKFFMDDTGRDFKVYTPLDVSTVNETKA